MHKQKLGWYGVSYAEMFVFVKPVVGLAPKVVAGEFPHKTFPSCPVMGASWDSRGRSTKCGSDQLNAFIKGTFIQRKLQKDKG